MRRPPGIVLATTGAIAGAAFVLSPAGAGIRHAFVTEHVDRKAPPFDPKLPPQDQPPPSHSTVPRAIERERQREIASSRRFWGWTRSRELAAEHIFFTDPAMKPLFSSRKVTVVDSGPWNATNSRAVIGFALVVMVPDPVHGLYSLPHITSYRTGSFKSFKTGTAGAKKFEIVVSFKAKRVADVSPVDLPAVRRKVVGG
jgi:hypothetical protein